MSLLEKLRQSRSQASLYSVVEFAAWLLEAAIGRVREGAALSITNSFGRGVVGAAEVGVVEIGA